MLIHKVRQNETRVINFQGSAPNGLREEMLRNASEQKVIKVSLSCMFYDLTQFVRICF